MKSDPKIGSTFERSFVVTRAHLITFADARMPAVLSTPMLIAELEYTARDSVAPMLEEHERTVGTEVDVKHLAPTMEGITVVCVSRILRVEGGEISFQVEASDGVDTLARGHHRRHVVDVDRVRRRLERKSDQLRAKGLLR